MPQRHSSCPRGAAPQRAGALDGRPRSADGGPPRVESFNVERPPLTVYAQRMCTRSVFLVRSAPRRSRFGGRGRDLSAARRLLGRGHRDGLAPSAADGRGRASDPSRFPCPRDHSPPFQPRYDRSCPESSWRRVRMCSITSSKEISSLGWMSPPTCL